MSPWFCKRNGITGPRPLAWSKYQAALRHARPPVHGGSGIRERCRHPVHDTERYGSTVAEVILPDGRNLNQELVRAGLAWWYQRYARGATVLAALEQEARDAKRGLWSDPRPVPPWEWRKAGAATRR